MKRLVVLLSVASSMAFAEPLAVRAPDGVTLAAQTWGNPDGREIVLVHGLGQSHLAWKRQYEGTLGKTFRIVTYDLRGHGDSDKPVDDTSYTDGKRWGDDLAAVIAAAQLKRPILVGWSIGAVAIEKYLAQNGDSHIAGVVLVDPVMAFRPDLFTAGNAGLVAGLSAVDLDERTRAIARFVRACFASPPAQGDLDQMLVYNGMASLPMMRALAHTGISLTNAERVWRRAKVPAWIVFGVKDELVNRAMVEYAHHLLAGSKLSIYGGSGHAPFYDESDQFDEALAAFVTASP